MKDSYIMLGVIMTWLKNKAFVIVHGVVILCLGVIMTWLVFSFGNT